MKKLTTLLIVLISLMPQFAMASVIFQEDFESDTIGSFESAGLVGLAIPPFSNSVGLGGISVALETTGFGAGAIIADELEQFTRLTPSSGLINDIYPAPPFAINGSAIRTTITHQAGDLLSFDFNFLTTFLDSSADFAFVFIDNSLTGLASIVPSLEANPVTGSRFRFHTGVQSYQQIITNTGTSTLSFAVVNVGGPGFQSSLVLDNIRITRTQVSESSSLLTLFAGFCGLVLFERIKRRNRKVFRR